jgi:Ca2+-binding EF-hand superfamily protein
LSDYTTTFAFIDGDNEGLISADELLRLMDVLGEPITAESAQGAIAKVDADNDGRINLQEFGVWLESRSS